MKETSSDNKKEFIICFEDKLEKFINTTIKTFGKEIEERGCVGSIAEIYDSRKIKYNRMDLMTRTKFMLEQDGMEKYSYFFYRQFA